MVKNCHELPWFFAANFIVKNQGQGYAPSTIENPNLPGSGLCPNKAVIEYLEATKRSMETGLFLHPLSGKSRNAGQISYWLAKAISWMLPCAMGKAHDVG